MCEKLRCIDDLLEDAWDFRCPRYRVSIFVRTKIYNNLIDFLGGKGINPQYTPCDTNYRLDRMINIATIVYNNRYRDETYRIEEKQKQPKVTAMKFMDKGRNDRLYCREIDYGIGKYVIICEIRMGKKSEKLSKKEKNIIERTRSYEFDILT
jgi:hypothetical protein